MDATGLLDSLNEQQRAAASFGNGPLLIVAGAGTGKTKTLVHRVAHLIASGINPGRILLLTFTRRAAAEMTRRVRETLDRRFEISDRSDCGMRISDCGLEKEADPSQSRVFNPQSETRNPQSQTNPKLTSGSQSPPLSTQHSALTTLWSGTFHAIANRLLRLHARPLGLGEAFTVLDRSDAEDLLNVVRSELELDKGDVRFPKKGTCLSIYSRCVNAQEPVETALKFHFPWCEKYPDALKTLFKAYVARKQEQDVLDYDDLLLYWYHLMQDESLAAAVRERFDAVLVDEYQDTNALQAAILKQLRPDGTGVTVVGDDAQSIYSFRAATVHNILDFPKVFPGATVLKLEQNYRSVQPILEATNRVIALCPHRYNKDLFSARRSQQKPRLVTLIDEEQQSDYIIRRVLEHHEAGIALRKQAVLFRAAHHSDALEVELSRRNIPFVKYGGLKFLEAAHVKDALSFLRLAENPRDATSAMRVLMLLDGVGPACAKKAIGHLAARRFELKSLDAFPPPPAASEQWPAFVSMMVKLGPNALPLADQVAEIRKFYTPILEKRYDAAQVRARDLEQLEQVCGSFRTRAQMLSELTLDPPASTQDLAGPPLMEEDYLILSTIHSAKGCEWDAVYVLHAADGNIPSDMATGSEAEVEEERRLFYVALTRARDFLEVCVPLRYYAKKWGMGDRHSYAQLTRFLPEAVVANTFERVRLDAKPAAAEPASNAPPATDIRRKIAAMWA